MKFSVITPFYAWHQLKVKQLQRCVHSVDSNRYFENEWEHILVNDGSSVPFKIRGRAIKTINQARLERIHALNAGLKKAKGDWIVFIDSDDELMSHALLMMSQMIEKYPEYKVFNFESFHIWKNGHSQVRGSFKPPEKEVGHEVFGGGTIVHGTYIFHRSCMGDDIDKFLPPTTSPWDFSTNAQEEFPEIKPFFTADHPDHPEGVPRELGNPWGQDFYMFYKLTRTYHSKAFDIPLVTIHHEGKDADGCHTLE